VKVKEPRPTEIARFRRGRMLFTWLQLAADRARTEGLLRSRADSIAYETVTERFGALPPLAPMSGVAGRMAIRYPGRRPLPDAAAAMGVAEVRGLVGATEAGGAMGARREPLPRCVTCIVVVRSGVGWNIDYLGARRLCLRLMAVGIRDYTESQEWGHT
jgi:hypothetical protein